MHTLAAMLTAKGVVNSQRDRRIPTQPATAFALSHHACAHQPVPVDGDSLLLPCQGAC